MLLQELLRAEIESLKSGNDGSDRSVTIYFNIYRFPSSKTFRVKDLESQVSSLESEIDRISQLLDNQKSYAAEVEARARQAAEETSRDISSKVSTI